MTDEPDDPKPDAARPRNPEGANQASDDPDDLDAEDGVSDLKVVSAQGSAAAPEGGGGRLLRPPRASSRLSVSVSIRPPAGGFTRDADDLDADESLRAAAQGQPLPLRSVAIVVLVVFAAMAFALQPAFAGSIAVWAIMGTAYCGLGLYAVLLLKRAGTLKDRLSFRAGDASVGIVLGLGLAGAGLAAQQLLAPDGSNGALWLLQLYEVAGDFQTNGPLIALLVLVSALEELVWRGLVQDTLTSVRPRSAPALTALAYTVSVAPSAILLTSDVAGPNPLLLFAALGCGLVWSYARIVLPRLFPVMVSHMVFTYFMAAPLPHWF